MKKYFSLIRCGFLEGIAYRNSFITGLMTNFIQIVVLYYVWKSIFSYQDVVNGYTWETMSKYILVSFLCNSALSFGFEMQTAYKIINGDIILDLLKPLSYRSIVFCKAIGTMGIEFLFTMIFVGGLYLSRNGIFGIEWLRCILFLISLFFGQSIKFNIQYFFSLICFYTDNGYGVLKGREILTNFFSGALIPIAMFPEICRDIINLFPFSGIVYIPCSIFIGTFTIYESILSIFFQMLWTIILYFLGGAFWKKASSVISLYGG